MEDGEITLPSQAKDPEEPLAEQLDEEVFQPPAQESLCPVKEDGTNFIALDCEMVSQCLLVFIQPSRNEVMDLTACYSSPGLTLSTQPLLGAV